MNAYYNQNYSREQIEDVLNKIKECVKCGRFVISMNENRQENIDFINEYNINSNKRKKILMKISVKDFCHTLNNTKKGFEYEILYVFVPQVNLYNAIGELETINLYTKFNVIEKIEGSITVVISFHRCNKPIDYLFR